MNDTMMCENELDKSEDAAKRPILLPGSAFSCLEVPENVELLRILSPAGYLSAFRVRVEEDRRGVVLMVPGFTGSKEDFYSFAPLLARDGWEVWAISQRGQADSAAPQGVGEYTREKTADDVLAVAREIASLTGVSRVHLLGHSFGGTVAQAAVIRDSAPFESLTLMDSGPCGWDGRHADIISKLTCGQGKDLWSLDNPHLHNVPREKLSTLQHFLADRSEATSNDQLFGALTQLADVHDTSFEVADTGLPVCVIFGVHDYWSWPLDWLRREARITHAYLAEISNAGHGPHQDNPEETARELNAFWTSLSTHEEA